MSAVAPIPETLTTTEGSRAGTVRPGGAGGAGGAAGSERVLDGLVTRVGLVRAAILLPLFAGVFFFFFRQQHAFSIAGGDWSHSYMVPLISLYILWQKRAELARTPAWGFWPGLLPLLMGIACFVLFQVSSLSNHMLQGWAMVLTVFGLVLLLTGPRVAAVAFLPVAYLVFGVTISDRVMIVITYQLQLVASQGAWALLNVVGVPTEVAGNLLTVIDNTGAPQKLNVAEACSGMRMVIAFLALGVAVALTYTRHWWQRAALLLMAVPVALLMNVLRVAVLGVATLYDPALAAGESHMLIGTVLLVPAFFLYMGLAWALKMAVAEPAPRSAPGPVRKVEARRGGPVRPFACPAFVAAFVILAVSVVAVHGAVVMLGLQLRKLPIEAPGNRRVQAVPTETASWRRVGSDAQMSADLVKELGTENYLSRVYAPRDGQGPRVELHLAYYTGMIDTVPHVPERCMVGAGWELRATPRLVRLPLDQSRWRQEPAEASGAGSGPGGVIHTARLDVLRSDATVERVRLPRNPGEIDMLVTEFGYGQARQLAGYFFVANGGHASSAEGVRLLAFDLKERYAYYLKVQVSSMEVADAEELARHAASLLDELLPEIMRCVPDWVDVERGTYPPDNPARGKSGDGGPG